MKRTAVILMVVFAALLVAFAAVAQADTHKGAPTGKHATTTTTVYYCAKCSHVQGMGQKCEKCGGPVQKVNADDLYWTCDMCKETSTHPGKCPKCGMEMTAKVKETAKAAEKAPEKAPEKVPSK